MKKDFSFEINGLRGLAVALVFLFHLNQDVFFFGYIGVDIFFVISGFVITKLIYDKQEKNDFSFISFYLNRFQRLYPALFIFVFFGTILIFFINITGDFKTFINTGIFSLLGISNLYLSIIENDYFNALDINPFIHTWSLSIEFQFYLFFPFFIIFCIKNFKNETYIIISLIVLIFSFLILSNFFYLDSFYQSSARIWEPLFGSLAFYLKKNKVIFKSLFKITLAFLIFVFLIYLNLSVSLNIIIATIMGLIVILQMESNFLLNNFLRSRLFQFVGNISYSIYLWHFLIIYFVNSYFIKIDYYLFSILFTLILSSFSYYFIENPVRRSSSIKNILNFINIKVIISTSLVALFILLSIKFLNFKNNILFFYNQKITKIYNSVNIKKKFKHNTLIEKKLIDENCNEIYSIFDNEFLKKKKCYLDNNKKKLIYVFGDSHSWHFQPLFKNIDLDTDILLTSYNNSSFSKPFFTGVDKNFSATADIATKKLFNNLLLLSKKYSDIYLVLSFNHLRSQLGQKGDIFYKTQERNYSTLSKILPANVTIIFLEDTPTIKHNENTCNIAINLNASLFNSENDTNLCDYKRVDVKKKLKKINKMFQNLKTNNLIYSINIIDYFCPTDRCNFYHPEKKFALIFDGSHINYETSIDLIKKVKEDLKKILDK